MIGRLRELKKLTILIIFIATIIIILVILFPPPPKPICENGKLDEGEKQIDCGGICAKSCPPNYEYDINKEWAAFVKDGEENYDLIARVNNINTEWGVSSVNYRFTMYDKNNEKIGAREGSTYIIPKGYTENNGEKYIIESDFPSKIAIKKVKFELFDYSWEEVEDSLDIPELNDETIKVKDGRYGKPEDGSDGYYAYGVTRNNSIYSFNEVEIKVVLFDKNNNPIAAGKSNQNGVGTNSGWEFRVFWNESFEGEVDHADFEAETNIFATENFIKKYGTGRNYEDGAMKSKK